MTLFYLSGEGKNARDNCVKEINAFIREIKNCQSELSNEVGIGTEFLNEKIEELIEDAGKLVEKMNGLS